MTALPAVRPSIAIRNPPVLRGGPAEGGQSAIRNSSIPVNSGGGLMGDGHPVGATGVRQGVEAYQQLTATAGARQIQGADRFLTFNMGGSVTTSVVMIWGRGG